MSLSEPKYLRTVDEMNDAPIGQVVEDKQGDFWTKQEDGYWETPETITFAAEYIVKHWGPLKVVAVALPRPAYARRFVLDRDTDATGVSGTGVVADGVEFPNGVVVLQWRGDWPTSVVFHDRGIESVQHIHGHSGATRLVWLD